MFIALQEHQRLQHLWWKACPMWSHDDPPSAEYTLYWSTCSWYTEDIFGKGMQWWILSFCCTGVLPKGNSIHSVSLFIPEIVLELSPHTFLLSTLSATPDWLVLGQQTGDFCRNVFIVFLCWSGWGLHLLQWMQTSLLAVMTNSTSIKKNIWNLHFEGITGFISGISGFDMVHFYIFHYDTMFSI